MTWGMVAVAGATLVTGVMANNASNRAASGAQSAAQNANQLQWDMYQQNRGDQAPWRNTGGAALGQLGNLMGLQSQGAFNSDLYLKDHPEVAAAMAENGKSAYDFYLSKYGENNAEGSKYFGGSPEFGSMGRDFSMSDYQADPGYQFRLEQGAKALERAGAARGSQLSGAQMKGLTDYNSGMASQEYGNAYNRFMQNRTTRFGELSNLAGLGQSSVGQTGQTGANTANQMGNNLTGAATVAGNAGMANAGTWGNSLNGLANSWNQYQMMNNMQNGGLAAPGAASNSAWGAYTGGGTGQLPAANGAIPTPPIFG